MTPSLKLTRIAAKCRELLAMQETRLHCAEWKVRYLKDGFAHIQECREQAIAGWRSTLAAIEFAAECEEDGYKAHSLTEAILAAWTDDIL